MAGRAGRSENSECNVQSSSPTCPRLMSVTKCSACFDSWTSRTNHPRTDLWRKKNQSTILCYQVENFSHHTHSTSHYATRSPSAICRDAHPPSLKYCSGNFHSQSAAFAWSEVCQTSLEESPIFRRMPWGSLAWVAGVD